MKVKDILTLPNLKIINKNGNVENEINEIFACDLLSHVMGFASEGDILITVLNNINVLGVVSLLDLSCVIFTHDVQVNEAIINKANELKIPMLSTTLTTAKIAIELSKLGVM
jgi:serine kinase of HPr protein (carbohydrate metabolism regulator)